jgi:hypothetical protein
MKTAMKTMTMTNNNIDCCSCYFLFLLIFVQWFTQFSARAVTGRRLLVFATSARTASSTICVRTASGEAEPQAITTQTIK